MTAWTERGTTHPLDAEPLQLQVFLARPGAKTRKGWRLEWHWLLLLRQEGLLFQRQGVEQALHLWLFARLVPQLQKLLRWASGSGLPGRQSQNSARCCACLDSLSSTHLRSPRFARRQSQSIGCLSSRQSSRTGWQSRQALHLLNRTPTSLGKFCICWGKGCPFINCLIAITVWRAHSQAKSWVSSTTAASIVAALRLGRPAKAFWTICRVRLLTGWPYCDLSMSLFCCEGWAPISKSAFMIF